MKKTFIKKPSVSYTNRFGINFQSAYSLIDDGYDEYVVRITNPDGPKDQDDIYHSHSLWADIPYAFFAELERRGLDNHDQNVFWEILLRYGYVYVNGMCYNPEWTTEFEEGYVEGEDGKSCEYYGDVSIGYGDCEMHELNIFKHFDGIDDMINFHEDDLKDLFEEEGYDEEEEDNENDNTYYSKAKPLTASVTAAGYQNGTGKKLCDDRVEVIDLEDNILFRKYKTPYDIKLAYEAFWNHLSDTIQSVVVLVSRVKIHR